MVILGNASVSKGFTGFSATPMKIIGTGWYMAYYFFNKKRAKTQSLKFSINPDLEINKTIWNLMDTKGIKSLLKLTMPSIKFRNNYYFRKTVKTIDFEMLDALIEKSDKEDFNYKIMCEMMDKRYLKELDKQISLNEKKITKDNLIKESISTKEKEGT